MKAPPKNVPVPQPDEAGNFRAALYYDHGTAALKGDQPVTILRIRWLKDKPHLADFKKGVAAPYEVDMAMSAEACRSLAKTLTEMADYLDAPDKAKAN